MNITLRRAMISDAKAIYELCRSELGYDFSLEQVETNVRRLIGDSTNLLLVAEQNNELAGFVHANSHEPVYAPKMKSVTALVVREEFRKQGLGHSLVGAVENWAIESGASGVRLNSGDTMNDALHFYKSMGYEYIRTQYNFRKMLK